MISPLSTIYNQTFTFDSTFRIKITTTKKQQQHQDKATEVAFFSPSEKKKKEKEKGDSDISGRGKKHEVGVQQQQRVPQVRGIRAPALKSIKSNLAAGSKTGAKRRADNERLAIGRAIPSNRLNVSPCTVNGILASN